MFWLTLVSMTAAATAVALWPLAFSNRAKAGQSGEIAFYSAQLAEIERDVERGLLPGSEAAAARAETGRRLLAAKAASQSFGSSAGAQVRRGLASALGLAIIAGTGAVVYGALGSPAAADQPLAERQNARQDAQQAEAQPAADPVAQAVAHIEEEVAAEPNNAKAWAALAPVYLRLGRYADSAFAYRKVLELAGEDAALRASLGEAETAAAQGKVTPEAKADFEKALASDPNLAMAQYYLALGEEQSGDREKALATYEALLTKVADRPHWVDVINGRISALKGETPPDHSAAKAPTDDVIQGMVARLASRLAEKGGTSEEWMRLVRSYAVMGRKDKAVAALAQARGASGADQKVTADLDAIEKELHLDDAGAAAQAEAPVAAVEATPTAPMQNPAAPPPNAVQGMVARLAARLADKGGTTDEWLRLIRSYGVLEQYEKARDALASARRAHGDDPVAKAQFDAIEQEFHLDAAAGAVRAPQPAAPAAEANEAAPAGQTSLADKAAPPQDAVQAMVARLAARLAEKGGTTQDWLKLIRSYGVLQQTDKARDALVSARKAHGDELEAKAEFDAIEQEFHLGAQ